MHFEQITRREFITLLGGAAAAWPSVGRAQPSGKLATIGFLGGGTEPGTRTWLAAFVQRLRELGWIESRTVAIEVRWAEGHFDRFADIAAEFIRLKVDVIVTAGPPVFAAKQATSVIPIVFATVADPLGSGLVASLARPGGNVTGLSLTSPDLAGKRLELLSEAVAGLRRLAVMANADYPPAVRELGEVEAAGRPLGIETIPLKIRQAADIAPAFESLQGRADALYVIGESLTAANQVRISTFAPPHGCPRCTSTANGSKPAVSCPMDRTSRACTGAPASWSTRFCAARSLRISRSSSRPSSIWPSI